MVVFFKQKNTNISQNWVRIEHSFGQIQGSFGYNAERTRYQVSVQDGS